MTGSTNSKMAYMFAQHFIYTGILSVLLVLKVYTRASGTNGPFVSGQQVLTSPSGLTSTIVVNAFIDLVEHDMP